MMALYTKKDFDSTNKEVQKKVQEKLKQMASVKENELKQKNDKEKNR